MEGKKIRIAVDFDGVIISFDKWKGNEFFGVPLRGARDFMENLFRNYFVIINTCRCNEEICGEPAELSANRIRSWLDNHCILYYQVWHGRGKVLADLYVDDRAVLCRPQEDGENAFVYASHNIRRCVSGRKCDADIAAERKGDK
jgi:hypothetical protein